MKKGILCLCLSAFGFALMTMFVRLADSCGAPLPAPEKALFRNLVAAGIAVAMFARARRRGAVIRPGGMTARDWTDLLLRSFFGTLGIFANFHAVSHIPIADAMALNKTAPFFTVLACWLIVGERVSFRQFAFVVAAMVGAMLVVKPGFGGGLNGPAMVGLSSGVCAGMAYAILHRLGRRSVNASFIILVFSAFSCFASIPYCLVGGVPIAPLQLLVLAAAGASAALGQFGITWAYRFAEPRRIAIYDYSGILFAALLGFIAFGQVPDLLSVLGFAIIVGCAIKMR